MKLQEVIDKMEKEIVYLNNEIPKSNAGSYDCVGMISSKLTILKYLEPLKKFNEETLRE